MDHLTHIVMSYKLLQSCGCDKRAAIYSLLPALDREPAHFHRVYGHIISNFPKILTTAIHVFADDSVSVDKGSYEYKRISKDREYFLSLAKEASAIINDDSILNPSSEKLDGGLSLLSHIYFDTYNNPVQAFLPDSVYSSGQWDFWRNIGYLTFRTNFYRDNVISAFRKGLFTDKLWNVKVDPYTLVKAMIIRLGDLSLPGVEYEVVDWKIREYLRFLGLDEYRRPDQELRFCKNLEKRITALIYECLNLK
jgi:hypothetical protein